MLQNDKLFLSIIKAEEKEPCPMIGILTLRWQGSHSSSIRHELLDYYVGELDNLHIWDVDLFQILPCFCTRSASCKPWGLTVTEVFTNVKNIFAKHSLRIKEPQLDIK